MRELCRLEVADTILPGWESNHRRKEVANWIGLAQRKHWEHQ